MSAVTFTHEIDKEKGQIIVSCVVANRGPKAFIRYRVGASEAKQYLLGQGIACGVCVNDPGKLTYGQKGTYVFQVPGTVTYPVVSEHKKTVTLPPLSHPALKEISIIEILKPEPEKPTVEEIIAESTKVFKKTVQEGITVLVPKEWLTTEEKMETEKVKELKPEESVFQYFEKKSKKKKKNFKEEKQGE